MRRTVLLPALVIPPWATGRSLAAFWQHASFGGDRLNRFEDDVNDGPGSRNDRRVIDGMREQDTRTRSGAPELPERYLLEEYVRSSDRPVFVFSLYVQNLLARTPAPKCWIVRGNPPFSAQCSSWRTF
jgi:hypothetical protein